MNDAVDVTELLEGEGLFHATGYARAKIQRRGRERTLRLPIRSLGVREALDAHARRRPRPPVVRELIRPEDPRAAELGIARPTWANAYDFSDAAYRAALEAHEAEAPFVVLAAALAVPIKDAAGKIAEGIEERARILAGLGLSTPQIEAMVRDVRELTAFREEEVRDFLPSGSEDAGSSGP